MTEKSLQEQHIPVMCNRVLELFSPCLNSQNAILLDATLGLAGHSLSLLEKFPNLKVIAFDRDEIALERAKLRLEKYLGVLATIATVAPLLGLFGTVVGMIEIFGSQGAINGAGSPQQLAHGISVALYNTAFGLLIAIPALAAWRGLRAMANQRQRECEEFTRQLFKKLFLTESAK